MEIKEISRQMENAFKQVSIKPSTVYFSMAAIASIVISLPSLQKYQVQMDAVRVEVQEQTAQTEKLQREAEFEKAQAAIADERYKQCLPVVGESYKNGTHYFTTLIEGQKITDRITGQNLPAGVVICDANGISGVIGEDGRLGTLAYTGNRDVVQARLKRFRGSQFSQPVVK